MKSQGQPDGRRARAMPIVSGGGPLPLAFNLHSQQVLTPMPSYSALSRRRRGIRFTAARAGEPEHHMGTAASNSGLVLAARCLATEKCTAGVNKADRLLRGTCLN